MHDTSGLIEVKRSIPAIQIPTGNSVTLPEGMQVTIVQELGDTFTLRTLQGYLLRIDGKDSDAIDRSPPAATVGLDQIHDAQKPVDEAKVREVLTTCYDPEIPSNIVELGLVYSVALESAPAGGTIVNIDMTLTAPGCGMGEVLKEDIERKLRALPGITAVKINLVFDPPWEPSMMSEAARLQLGMF